MSNTEITLHSPSHIGEFVREIVEGHGLNISSGARVLGVTRQTLSILLNCHGGLSSDMALRIEKAFGGRWTRCSRCRRHGKLPRRASAKGSLICHGIWRLNKAQLSSQYGVEKCLIMNNIAAQISVEGALVHARCFDGHCYALFFRGDCWDY
jgi:addiction module HigA family antidote